MCEVNIDGLYNFFVRSIDRFNDTTLNGLVSILSDEDPVLASDFLWATIQLKIEDFVNENDGSSNTIPFIKNRPDWNKVRDVLLGFRPISDLLVFYNYHIYQIIFVVNYLVISKGLRTFVFEYNLH